MEISGNNDELFNNLNFVFNNQQFKINNENDLLNYIGKINQNGINFEKKYKYKYLGKENIEEKNQKKFIPLFRNNNNIHESLNGNIKSTYNNETNDLTNDNNVFILNNTLEENQSFCYEIKLGNGIWDNIIDNKKSHSLKIGLLELNKEIISNINEYININQNRLELKNIEGGWQGLNLFQSFNNEGIKKEIEEYKKSIYYSINCDNLKVPVSKYKNNINDNKSNYRLPQKNDVIGVVYNNKFFNDFIELRIYINGELIRSDLIIKKKEDLNIDKKEAELDDDFIKEKNLKHENNFLVPFIEFGNNKTIFIKDKETKKKENWNKFICEEKIEYIVVYQTPPLNLFPEEIFLLQSITEAYFNILIKVGAQIFKNRKNDINKYFRQLTIFFKTFSFINRIVAENCLLDFLSNGINIENGNISSFKENVETLLNIINEIEKFEESAKISLLEKIICFLIEIIMEKNFNFLDMYKFDQLNHNQLENFRKYKFILCFLLFNNVFMQGDQNTFSLLKKVSILQNENNIFNFCSTVFNSCYYFDCVNAFDYIKKFYMNDSFDKKKFLDVNFRKYIGDNFYNKIFEDNQFMMKYIIKEIDMNNLVKTRSIIKFISGFCKSNDNISIINLIIIQLIKNYFSKHYDINKTKIENIIQVNYISLNKIAKNENNNSFYGKKDSKLNTNPLFNKNNLTDEQKKEALIFELIINSISNYYELFSLKEKNARELLEYLANHKNNYDNVEIYKINNMIEFHQAICFGNFYLYLGYFTNYLLKFLLFCAKEKYLEVVPYHYYLQNILFIIDMLKIRCSFIEKDNLIEKNEINLIYSNIDKVLKYVTTFLGEIIPRIKSTDFKPIDDFEKLISLNIDIFIKVLSFDKNIIKDSFNSVKDNLRIIFKNLSDLYDKERYKKLYSKINTLIEYIYGAESDFDKSALINISVRNIFFKEIMTKELDEFKSKLNDDKLSKNNYIEHTMYYNIFLLIYKRTKIIRESLSEILKDNLLFEKNTFYQENYLMKLTKILKIFDNFFLDNNLTLFYDTNSICFIKLNSFICKIFKLLHDENILQKTQKIYKENPKIFEDFYTTFFFLISHIFINRDNIGGENYYYQLARNRKGFYFEEFKFNFEIYFGYPECKMMLEFLDILLQKFRQLCNDNDVLNIDEVNDNSVDLDNVDKCAICLELTGDKNTDAHIEGCNHVFHMECIKQMISKNMKKCPICKRGITGIKEDPNFKVDSIELNNGGRSLFSDQIRGGNLFLFGGNSSRNDSQRREGGLFRENSIFGNNNNNVSLFGRNNDNNLSPLFGNNGGLFGNNNSNNNNNQNLFRGINLFGSP